MLNKILKQNRISALESKIKILEKENENLHKEIISLKEMNDLLKNSSDEVLKDYTLGVREIKDLKKKYNDLISDVSKSKKEYENKISLLFGKIDKDKLLK